MDQNEYLSFTLGGRRLAECSSDMTGKLTIPDSVEMIQSFAFCDCTSFSGNVRIGKNVKTMGNRVFWNCKDINVSVLCAKGYLCYRLSVYIVCCLFRQQKK